MIVPEKELPQELTTEQAVEAAYTTELASAASDLVRGLPVLLECEKDLAPFAFLKLRDRLKPSGWKCVYLDGRPRNESESGMAGGIVSMMIHQLRDAVRGATEKRVVVLPHLDLLTAGHGGLTPESREVIPLLYENPEHVWLGFKDPSFALPKVIESLFPRRYSLLGVSRPRLKSVVTQREARKFGRDFKPWNLYKFVSGMNAVRLRKLLSSLDGEDFPATPKRAYAQVRQATLHGFLEVPDVDLDRDLGGYVKVKQRLRSEILDVLAARDALSDESEVTRLESLIPRGMIFWGPPGTGKTLFAKAMATALGAAITVVSGPELKSRWVGESEENLRQIFHRARQSAPAIIVFDELDSFASARGTYTGSGVEHSMVNQLLTEMDGFHREELVFVVGTTNFVESLDPALLRPGRFEFQLHIPYPDADDRREILKIYDSSMRLGFTPDGLEAAVRRTAERVEGTARGTRFSGDHLNALCRSLARIRLREGNGRPTNADDVERALTEWVERPERTAEEELVIATHEAGHAVCAMHCEHAPPLERVSIRGDGAAFGFERHEERTHRFQVTRGQLLDDLCVLFGGREAEQLLLNDLSIGSAEDLRRATAIARALVEEFGMGGEAIGTRRYRDDRQGQRQSDLADTARAALDHRVDELLQQARERAATILQQHRPLVETLRDLLLQHQTVDARTISRLTGTE